MISDPAIGSPGLTSESDSVGYQPVIDNSPRRLVIETLALPKNETLIENFETKTKCFLCDLEFDLNIERETFLAHVITNHKLVIGEVELISDLTSYVAYWRTRFMNCKDLSRYCTIIKTNSNQNDPAEPDYYFFLNDSLPEDRAIREQLHNVRLDLIIQYQEEDRNESFDEMCLFCSQKFVGGREACIEFFRHMNNTHQFNIGHPDNMVFVKEFIETLRSRLKDLQCLSCAKTFKDRNTLKDHMRKKSHRGLNKDDRSFDKFYLINYLEMGKRWTQLSRDPDEDLGEDQTWTEFDSIEHNQLYCFFCDAVFNNSKELNNHLYSEHDFEFEKIKENLNLTFYEQMKLINWIRKEKVDLERNKEELNIMDITERILAREWDNPQFYFPTYADDHLLQYIDFDCSKIDEEDKFIFIEDFEAPSDIRSKSILKDLVKDIQSESLPTTNKKVPYHVKTNQKNSNPAPSNRSSVPSDRKNKRKPKNPNVKDKKDVNK